MFRRSTRFLILALVLSTLAAWPSGGADTAAADKDKEPASEPPKTAEDGLQRLEKILGRFNSKDARQFRMTIDSEYKNRPEADKPPVVVVSKGTTIIGTPFRQGGSIAFDVAEDMKRTVYEVGEGDNRKVIRRQQRHYTERYLLSPDDAGAWTFDATFLSHSIPTNIGRCYLKGDVKFLDDGVEFTGIGTDSAYAAEGKLIRVAVYGKFKFSRQEDRLVITDQWQNYQLLPGPDGDPLPVPDFKKPVGQPVKWMEGKSEPEGK